MRVAACCPRRCLAAIPRPTRCCATPGPTPGQLDAVQLTYVNPETGRDVQNILGYHALLLRPGQVLKLPARSPASVFHVIEGPASAQAGERCFTLAEAEKINQSYLCRVLRLTLLAPEIIEGILDGGQPAGLQIEDLLKPIQLEWGRQLVIAGLST